MSQITTSEAVNEVAGALAKAQAEMSNAKKDSVNPHFRSSYADLASVREACLSALTKHGIAVVQSPRLALVGEQTVVELETRFLHSSGQWMADTLAVPVSKVDAQGVGSAITYARRYALASFAGIAPADDDAESAVGRAAPAKASVMPEGFMDWWTDIQSSADEGEAKLKSAWEKSPAEYRQFVAAERKQAWEATKARAKKVAA